MRFCTTINCMDGRVQLPVIHYLKERYQADYVDSITEPGPNGILAQADKHEIIENILLRVDISVKKHKSGAIAVVGHHDCAGNPVTKEIQIKQILQAVKFLQNRYPIIEIIGLWIDENWTVHQLNQTWS